MINESSILHRYEDLYTDRVDGRLLIYNPISEKGIRVIRGDAIFLFNLIDGKKTAFEIMMLAKKKNSRMEIFRMANIFNFLADSEIIYFDKPKDKKELFSRKPTNLSVWLHITNQCNLRCTYCYVHKSSDSMGENLAKKILKKAIDTAQKHEYKRIIVKFSGGECLLKFPLILELVRLGRKYTQEKNIEIRFVVLTNGVLVTKEIAKILKDENIRVAVSLDGLEKYHDTQRVFADGSGSFRFVEKGIKNLQKAKVPFSVTVVITSKNVEHIPQLTKYLLEKGVRFNFSFYRENPNVKEELEGDDKKLVKYLKETYKVIADNLPAYSVINNILDRVSFMSPHLRVCAMGQSYIVFRQDGKITSCQMTLETPMGSIDDRDLIETMKKGSFLKPKTLTVEDRSPCKDCQWKYICCGGCPLLTFEQKGKYNVSSPYCAVYKALIPEVLRLEARRLIRYGTSLNKKRLQKASF